MASGTGQRNCGWRTVTAAMTWPSAWGCRPSRVVSTSGSSGMVLRSAGVAHYASAGKTGCGIMKVFTPFAWRINVMTASIECVKGDISRQQDLVAVVNAANAQLQPGGGVAGALHRAAGPELARACRPLAPIRPGQAVITPGFDLPNLLVSHVLGPRYDTVHPAKNLLVAAYESSLALAGENNIRPIGFPALSARIFGYPLDEAVRIAIDSVGVHAPQSMRV